METSQVNFSMQHRRFNIYKICQVCLAPARKDVNLFHHYGAVCCLSCKAFFRRYVRGENNLTTFKCKTGGRCDITGSRTSCKKCRYTKCLTVGMDPSKVLNEEERKKYSQKRIRLDPDFSGNNNGSGSDGPVSETEQSTSQSSPESFVQMDQDLPAPPPLISSYPSLMEISDDNPILKHTFRTPSPMSSKSVTPVRIMPKPKHRSSPNFVNSTPAVSAAVVTKSGVQRANSVVSGSNPERGMIDLASLVESAQTTFVQEVYKEFTYDPRLANLLVQGHLDTSIWCGSHSGAFLNIMETVVPFMHLAALKSPQFKEVCSHDQRLLLKNNAILLREYMMARYLIAETGMEQLVWAFGPSDSIKLGVDDVYKLAKVDFDRVNGDEGYIISAMNPPALECYKNSLKVIEKYFHYPPFYTPLIANFFLFSITAWNEEDIKDLTEPDKVKELEIKARAMIMYGSERIPLGLSYLNQLIHTLLQMASLKENKLCQFITHGESQYCAIEERLWIKQKMTLFFGEISHSTKPDENSVGRMIAHHLGADELRHVVLFDLFKIQAKRYHQLLTTGFGIQNPILVEQNMNLCNMLIGIKADQTPTVLDCMKMYTGVVDMGHFEEMYKNVPNRPKIDNPHFCESIGRDWPLAKRTHFAVGNFIARKDVFFLTLLTFLFHGIEEYSHWAKSIKRLLMKRLNDYMVIKGICDPETIFDKFCQDLFMFVQLTQGIIKEGRTAPSTSSGEITMQEN